MLETQRKNVRAATDNTTLQSTCMYYNFRASCKKCMLIRIIFIDLGSETNENVFILTQQMQFSPGGLCPLNPPRGLCPLNPLGGSAPGPPYNFSAFSNVSRPNIFYLATRLPVSPHTQ